MAVRLKTWIVLLPVTFLVACYETDFSGFFTRDQSVNQRFDQSMEWNALNPYREITVLSDTYRIFTIGDSHVGGTVNLKRFLAFAQSESPVAIVMAGDMTTGRKADYMTFNEVLPDQDILPWFMLAGNHELYFGGWEHYHALFGTSVYLFTVQTPAANDLYICLDTGSGTLGSKQLEWLRETLKDKRDDFRHCVVFTHNNLFRVPRTITANPPVEELHVLMDLFARHRVDYVITGHVHKREVFRFGNTTYVVLDALKDGLPHASYLDLMIEGAHTDFSFVKLDDLP